MDGHTLAFAEAKSLCADVAALFYGAHPQLRLPTGTDGDPDGPLYYDELVQTELALRLPPMPGRLPAPEGGSAELPRLLRAFLASLRVAVSGRHAPAGDVIFTKQWQLGPSGSSFWLQDAHESLDAPGSPEVRTPLRDASFAGGVSYDADAKVWRIAWLADMSVGYPRGNVHGRELALDAHVQLRIDFAQLMTFIDVVDTQPPFHFTSNALHPFTLSSDPYFFDVDLLATYGEGVYMPDETPEQRHDALARRLCTLPLSTLFPGTTGAPGPELVCPWQQSQRLSLLQRRAREVDAVSRAGDVDIVIAAFETQTSAAMKKGQDMGLGGGVLGESVHDVRMAKDVATVATTGIIAFERHVQLTRRLLPIVLVRMRTLCEPHIGPLGPSESLPRRALLLSVELASALPEGDFVIDSLDISIGAPVPTPDSGRAAHVYETNDITPTVSMIPPPNAPGGSAAAPAFPILLKPASQYALLYAVTLQCATTAPEDISRASASWAAQRLTRVTMLGAPRRRAATHPPPSCVSHWDGAVDLSLEVMERRRRAFASAVVLETTGWNAADAPETLPRSPLGAGRQSLRASALALPPLPPKHPPPAAARRHAGFHGAEPPQPRSYLSEARDRVQRGMERHERDADAGARPGGGGEGAGDGNTNLRHALGAGRGGNTDTSMRHAFAWGRDGLVPGSLDLGAVRSWDNVLMATVSAVPHDAHSEPVPDERGDSCGYLAVSKTTCRSIVLYISLFNVSPAPLRVIVSWRPAHGAAEGSHALLCTSTDVSVGPIAASTSAAVQIPLQLVAQGLHKLGELHVRDCATGAVCRLSNLGSVLVDA
ncbi:hypothetical protein MSPP1_001977 [Malassezia sp. CBS 17886]|nr:hypothetical protein MSPP1_001977 [Malassezia sp. CBS 17886]